MEKYGIYRLGVQTFGVSAGKRDQIENFFKKKFLSKIDVDLIIWSRTFIISKKFFLSIWSLFPALTPYITEKVTEKFLSCQLEGANLSKLKNISSFEVLDNFIRESFRISWNGKNLEAVKLLDGITKDLLILSRSWSNIVNLLNVS